ncbi:MAG: WXG100 family type VII secretion target, partial [Anaerolineae bacterium]|nr:WXG100 family type VII secretion target [Anaerolineae bacterium]
MTANIIQVKYDQLEQCARLCGQEAQRLEQLQRKLAGYVGKISEFWIGLGADEFESEMTDQFLPRLKRLTQALQEGQSAIQQISETFYQAEEM